MAGGSMISISPLIKIYLHREPVDMRKSYDGLFGIVKNDLAMDVRNGGLFMFINLRRNRVKVMYWDKDGIAIWQKRLERGTLQHPQPSSDAKHLEIDASELSMLLSGIDLASVRRRKRYVAPDLPTTNPSAVA
jgi:transposase